MTTEESLADLWRYIDAGRDREPVSRLVQSWLHARIEHHEQDAISPDLLYAITEKRFDWPGGEHYTPKCLWSARLGGRKRTQHQGHTRRD